MKIEPGQSVALDTNILLDATDEARPLHAKARSLLLRQGTGLCLGTQVLREYLVVATRPQENNGLGMTVEDAVLNVSQFRKRASILPETVEASELLSRWAVQYGVTGKRLHDLQLLATVHQAGVTTLITSNAADFPRDTDVRIVTLEEIELETARTKQD
jgi:predicted nucleic acid-binding protein